MLPTGVKHLLIINLLFYLAAMVFREALHIDLDEWLALFYIGSDHFRPWQYITYMFMHANFSHILFNMFALWMFGCVIENVWGPKKFIFYYIVCGIFAGFCQEIVQTVQFYFMAVSQFPMATLSQVFELAKNSSDVLNNWLTIGASGAVYAILLAFGMTFPNERIFIFPLPVPIKAKWFICIYAAIELFQAYNSSGDGVAHVAHLGGMLFGLLLILYWRKHPGSSPGIGSGKQFFENMKRNFEARRNNQKPKRPDDQTSRQPGFGPTREDDMEYNARKQQRQAEVDAILDKIRKSGYDSLTKEEKQRLFEASREK